MQDVYYISAHPAPRHSRVAIWNAEAVKQESTPI